MFSRLLLISTTYLLAFGMQYGRPRVLAEVAIPGLTESSGVVASRRFPGVFWTHNDSGDGPWLYALDRSGRSRGRWRVPVAEAHDWEDIAAGPGPGGQTWLYVGDIGDNQRRRRSIQVYRFREPDIAATARETERPAVFDLTYPDGPHDAECLLVHPGTGDLYIVTKAKSGDPETAVYKAAAPLIAGRQTPMRRIATLNLPETSSFQLMVGVVTGGDISPDGNRVALCDYFRAWEAVLPPGARSFDDIWSAKWTVIDTGTRKQGEGICYRHDGKALIMTSEGALFPLIEIE